MKERVTESRIEALRDAIINDLQLTPEERWDRLHLLGLVTEANQEENVVTKRLSSDDETEVQ